MAKVITDEKALAFLDLVHKISQETALDLLTTLARENARDALDLLNRLARENAMEYKGQKKEHDGWVRLANTLDAARLQAQSLKV